MLRQSLAKQHYQFDFVATEQAGWEMVADRQYDLLVLDELPHRLDAARFCQRLRGQGNLTPILLLVSSSDLIYRIRGLDAGADDCLVKPFAVEELLARVRALLRRGKNAALPLLSWGKIRLDPRACEVRCGGQRLTLTAKEYELLELFLRSPQRVFDADALLNALWALDDSPSENAVRTHIKTLRRKLRQAGAGEVLETVYGLGYRLRAWPSLIDENTSQEPHPKPWLSDNRWQSIIEGLALVVVGLDLTGRIDYINPYGLELLGYEQCEMLGRCWFDLCLLPQHKNEAHSFFQQLLKGAQTIQPYCENTIVTKAGEECWMGWHHTFVRDLDGVVLGTVSIGQEMGDRLMLSGKWIDPPTVLPNRSASRRLGADRFLQR